MDRKAKIVATVGPSCQDKDTLSALISAGMDVARLNFSHGTHEEHAVRIVLIRQLSQDLNKPITILQDLQGPKLRVGTLPQEGIQLTLGDTVVLTDESSESVPDFRPEDTIIPMDVPNLMKSVEVGKHILLDDGQLELLATEIGSDFIKAKVLLGGKLTSHKGVNFPGTHLDIPGFTEKDKADLEFGLDQGIDAIAISFVRGAKDIVTVRNAIKAHSPKAAKTPIIAKLELPEAIKNLHEIIHEADGVMVARGDLGVETSPWSVPILQKQIIQMANLHDKLVITATQMLDSMIHNPRPTRAEASDVSNAILDGTDAVMLSGETASGSYPLESVKMMSSIVIDAEEHYTEWGQMHNSSEEPSRDDAISIVRAAREMAHDRHVSAIAVFTQSGRTAILMSKARPRVPIMAFTPDLETYQRLGMYWGVTPLLVPYASSVESMVAHVEAALVSSTQLQPGDKVVMITGMPVGTMQSPNFALLHTIGDYV